MADLTIELGKETRACERCSPNHCVRSYWGAGRLHRIGKDGAICGKIHSGCFDAGEEKGNKAKRAPKITHSENSVR